MKKPDRPEAADLETTPGLEVGNPSASSILSPPPVEPEGPIPPAVLLSHYASPMVAMSETFRRRWERERERREEAELVELGQWLMAICPITSGSNCLHRESSVVTR